jgi:hypothetical protein
MQQIYNPAFRYVYELSHKNVLNTLHFRTKIYHSRRAALQGMTDRLTEHGIEMNAQETKATRF